MPPEFKRNRAIDTVVQSRRETVLERLRTAVDTLDRENRALQENAAEFQDVLGELRAGLEDLAESTDDCRLNLSAIDAAPLGRAARRLGVIADGWLERDRGTPRARPSVRSGASGGR
ncbi:MAG: hypothetical protein COW30_16040 [Rhodospirillales bacterium CG15_BIG_FIL_POST_REV_8_21_14_020_66_15]|nr:MAG: hypothetical protein COW30_16040 [Rhodospirillales bacterium CG15_BIG_FIL_POST_REV_8_21_14_020_66_15]